MNRREILRGGVAVVVVAAIELPVAEATATWVQLHDGTPFNVDLDPEYAKLLLDGPDYFGGVSLLVDGTGD